MNKTCHECDKNKSIMPYEYLTSPLTVAEYGGGLYQAQQGGDQQQQIMQLIVMYAKLHNTQPEMIIQKLQQLDESQQQQAIQSMVAELQQGGAGQQQSAPMSYAGNDESTEMESSPQFAPGGTNSYSQTGGGGYRGAAGGVGGVPYIAPALQVSLGDSKSLGFLKGITGYMGLGAGLAASGLGYGKGAQWLGNKVLPDGGLKDGFNSVMDGANNALKGIVDFGVSGVMAGNGQYSGNKQVAANRKQPVTFPNQNPALKNRAMQKADFTKMPMYNDDPNAGTMVAEYGGYLPKHQGDAGSSTVGGGGGTGSGEAGMMMNDGSADYNQGYFQAEKQNNDAYKNADMGNLEECAPGSECDKAKKKGPQQPLPQKKKADPASAGQGEKPFSGMEYAQKGMMGFGAFRDFTQWKNDQKERNEYEDMLKRTGNTDFRLASNSPNPYGDFTMNVGPANNFQLGMTTPVQDSGTTGRYGGSFKYGGQSFAEGGEYQVSEEELLQLMQNGAEIEFINK